MLAAAGAAFALVIVGVGVAGPATADQDDTAEGGLPNGQRLSPFDLSNPAVNRLDPALLDAIEQAADDAATQGITIGLTSGWRSSEFQQQLFDDAVVQYGSAEIASAPTRKNTAVRGRRRAMPPRRSRSTVCVARYTAPAA